MPIISEKLTLLGPSPRLGPAVLFHAGGTAFRVDDAVASALFRGELDAAIDETLALLSAEECAEAEGFTVDDGALQARSERFRYEHDLISAGETEAWLNTRGMTTEDFGRWLYQRLCPSAAASDQEMTVPEDFADLLRIHLWFSGRMDDLAKDLRRRVAADLELSHAGRPVSGAPAMQRFFDRHELEPGKVSEWLSAFGRDRTWLDAAARMEAAFDQVVAGALDMEARQARLRSMQLSLARIEMETLELDSQAAAREAVLCVKDDGASLASVARDAGYHAERAAIWIDDLDPRVAQRLLGAAAGEVVGPIECDRRFVVHQVIRKIEPALSDPVVSERVDAAVIDACFDDLCSRHIQ